MADVHMRGQGRMAVDDATVTVYDEARPVLDVPPA